MGQLIRLVSGIGRSFAVGEFGHKLVSWKNEADDKEMIIDDNVNKEKRHDLVQDFVLWFSEG